MAAGLFLVLPVFHTIIMQVDPARRVAEGNLLDARIEILMTDRALAIDRLPLFLQLLAKVWKSRAEEVFMDGENLLGRANVDSSDLATAPNSFSGGWRQPACWVRTERPSSSSRRFDLVDLSL